MKNNRKGFTLIEMLVVVAIVGLLSSVVVVGVGGARQKARDAKRVSDVRQIQTWFESSYTTEYPTAWATAPIPQEDPSGGVYGICVTNNGQGYAIGTTLEDVGMRPQGGLGANPTCTTGVWPSMTCAATGVVYCVSSD
jgi:prepilin-type N-terminal cleavage/methylation domain-containing protein